MQLEYSRVLMLQNIGVMLYRDVWMNRMTKYNGKALLLTRQMVKDGNTTYYSAYYNGKWVGYVNSYALKNTVTKDTYQGWGT